MRWIIGLLFVLGLAGWSGRADAWGNTAHRLTCEIAVQNLTPAARAELTRLLRDHPAVTGPVPRREGYGWACTYADTPLQGSPGRRASEHFVNYPRTAMTVTAANVCGGARVCVASGILADFAVLRDRARSDTDRGWALVYLGHWAADSHAPLHHGFGDDLGGNEIMSTGLCTRSLHSSWDTCILEARHPIRGAPDAVIAALAADWAAQAGAAERRQWRASQPWQWSAESLAISLRPELGYCVRVGRDCHYSATQASWASGQPQRSVPIDAAYMDRAMPVIRQRLTQAGIRLAHLLNRALDPGYRG